MNDDTKTQLIGSAVDVVSLACLTLLMALHVMPIETGLPVFTLLLGAKAMHKATSGGPPAGGAATTAQASAALTLLALLGGAFLKKHGTAAV